MNNDEVREEWRRKMGARLEERLNQAVLGGKITEEQKKAILAKMAEMQAKREKMRKEFREEMEAWAKENNVDLKQLLLLMRGPRKIRGGRLRSWFTE